MELRARGDCVRASLPVSSRKKADGATRFRASVWWEHVAVFVSWREKVRLLGLEAAVNFGTRLPGDSSFDVRVCRWAGGAPSRVVDDRRGCNLQV